MIILVCNLEKSRKVERVEKSGNAPPGEIGYEKILITDCKCKLIQRARQRIQEDVVCRLPTVPTQHRPSGSHTIQRHVCRRSCFSKQFFLFHHLVPQSWCHYSHIVQSRRGLWHAELFYGRPRCPALPECQSARPTSMIARPTRSVTL